MSYALAVNINALRVTSNKNILYNCWYNKSITSRLLHHIEQQVSAHYNMAYYFHSNDYRKAYVHRCFLSKAQPTYIGRTSPPDYANFKQ